MSKKILFLFAALFFHSAVSNGNAFNLKYSHSPYPMQNIREAIDFAMSMVDGEITKIEKKFKKNIPIWEIKIMTANGGTIEVELSYKNLELLDISANEGPFDYTINTGKEFVNFSAAKSAAEKFASEPVLKWALRKSRDNWEYNFWHFTKTGKAQVKVDAKSGEVIIKTTKKTKKS